MLLAKDGNLQREKDGPSFSRSIELLRKTSLMQLTVSAIKIVNRSVHVMLKCLWYIFQTKFWFVFKSQKSTSATFMSAWNSSMGYPFLNWQGMFCFQWRGVECAVNPLYDSRQDIKDFYQKQNTSEAGISLEPRGITQHQNPMYDSVTSPEERYGEK